MSSSKERSKLAANVTRMIGALKAKALGGNSPEANAPLGRSTASTTSSAYRTPSRDRMSSPGSHSISSDDQPFDGKSFNHSRRGSGDRNSQASLLDLPDTHDVFLQGGFGMPDAMPSLQQQQQSQKQQQQAAGKDVSRPQPRRGDANTTSTNNNSNADPSRRTPRSSDLRTSSKSEGDRRESERTPRRSSNKDEGSRGGRSSRSEAERRSQSNATPLSSRSDTPLSVDGTAPRDRDRERLRPKSEKQYPSDAARDAEQSRKEQLREGRSSDARRSAPRRSESPRASGASAAAAGGAAASTEDGRSRSSQRRLQEASRRAVRSQSERPTAATAGQTSGGLAAAAVSASNYQLPQAIRTQSPMTAPPPEQTPRTSTRSTPMAGPLAPLPKSSSPASQSLAPPLPQSSSGSGNGDSQKAPSSPSVGIRRKAPGGGGNSSSTFPAPSGGGSTGAAGSPRSGGSGALGVGGGVAKAIAIMGTNTTRNMLNVSNRSQQSLGLGRDDSPDDMWRAPSTTSQNFSLADFVKETSSQYDFNRAPSRMSLGGGSNDGANTPVKMRGANLLDSISDQKFPAKPIPSSTAGVVDSTWLDATAKQTTFGGIEKQERAVRTRILHAAMFRPKVWFLNNVLPHLRQHFLREMASKKRKMFVEMAEPNFRLRVQQQHLEGMALIKCMSDESLDRIDLERATMLWRTQVKGAFDRLVQQLNVEQKRKAETVKQTVVEEIAKGANALAEKTSFSYLHLHTQFADALLKRTKELYVYYFGILASMDLKEEKERAMIASEQRFTRLNIEMDRIRFFIQHLELVEYDNILKYFSGEKRILESELRFKPKSNATRSGGGSNVYSSSSTTSRSASPIPTPAAAVGGGDFTIRHATNIGGGVTVNAPIMQASATPLSFGSEMRGRSSTPVSLMRESASPTPSPHVLRSQQQQQERDFDRMRKETQSPFPLDALERQQTYRRSQAQQQAQAQAEWQERELAGTPVAGTGRMASNARNPQENFLPTNRQLESQPNNNNNNGLSAGSYAHALPPPQQLPAQHQYPESYQQSNPMGQLRSFQQQQLLAAQQATLERMPPPAIAGINTANNNKYYSNANYNSGPSSLSNTFQSQRSSGGDGSRLAKQLEYEEAHFSPTSSSGPSSFAASTTTGRLLPPVVRGNVMGVEDRRRSDEDDMPLPSLPAHRGGPLLPQLEHTSLTRKEGGSKANASSASTTTTTTRESPTTPSSVVGGRLLPPIQNRPFGAPPAAAALSSAFPPPPPTTNDMLDNNNVTLLLHLHKSGGDTIAQDEAGVRRSLIFYEQEDKKNAIVAAGQNRSSRLYTTRLEKLLVEEQELRHELELQQRNEYGLHVQRQQWVEYFLLSSEESSERERIVGMSHLSKAIVAKNAKQDFSVTCLMQHQVLALHQMHVYERWFLTDVECPTSIGLKVYQTERRERNKIAMMMEKETRILSTDARERRATRALYASSTAINPVEFDALSSVEEVHRRNLARQFYESFSRFAFEFWEEPVERGVVALARERWFRDLVRPSQHRIAIHIKETKEREETAAEEVRARFELMHALIRGLYEAGYQDISNEEQRDYRRLSMNHLKERRQRQAREREVYEKRENMQRYMQSAIVSGGAGGGSPMAARSQGLGDALNRYMAATAAEIPTTQQQQQQRSGGHTPLPDYSVMLRAKQIQQQQQQHLAAAASPSKKQ